jgi:hypothetical protein
MKTCVASVPQTHSFSLHLLQVILHPHPPHDLCHVHRKEVGHDHIPTDISKFGDIPLPLICPPALPTYITCSK